MTATPAAGGVRARARTLISTVLLTIAVLACTGTAAAAAPGSEPAGAFAAAITTDIWRLVPAPHGASAPRSGVAAFQTTDNTGASMDGLDIIVNPVGPGRSYLGVYHVNLGDGRFALRLAGSGDLRTWSKIADLDASGGGMGTLRALPGAGFLLAYEAQAPTSADQTVDSSVRLRYYRDATALATATPTQQRTLPRLLSATNEGTPDIRAISWHGSLATSTIALGFHYLDHGTHSKPRKLAVDREALGTLTANRWTASADSAVDRALTRMGFDGNHGARRQFTSPDGHTWRVYEAQRYVNVTGSWRLLLYDVNARRWTRLHIATPGGSRAFANPTVTLLPSPATTAATALVMTTFVPAAGAGHGESGEAVTYLDL